MLRLDEALIAGVLRKTAGAPAKRDLMFCQLSATSEAAHCGKALSSGPPCHSSGDWLLPILHAVGLGRIDIFQGCQAEKGAHSSPDNGYRWEGGGRKSETGCKVLVQFCAAEIGGSERPSVSPCHCRDATTANQGPPAAGLTDINCVFGSRTRRFESC